MTIHANYTNPSSRYKIVTHKGEAHVTGIIFIADLSVEHKELPVASATEYRKVLGDLIAQTVRFDLAYDDKHFELAIHRIGPEGRPLLPSANRRAPKLSPDHVKSRDGSVEFRE